MPAWTLLGYTTAINGQQLVVSGTITTAELRALDAGGLGITIRDVVDNRGDVMDLDVMPQVSMWTSSTLLGGRVVGDPAKLVLGGPNFITLQGVRWDTELNLNSSLGGPIQFQDGLELNGTMLIDGRDARFMNTQTLGGAGTVVINYSSVPWPPDGGIKQGAGATLTIGPGMTVTTSNRGGVVGVLNEGEAVGHVSLINQGRIVVAPGGAITIGGRNWKNQGVIEVAAGGMLNLGGTFNFADLGDVRRAGRVVNFASEMDLTGGKTFDLNVSPIGQLDLGSSYFTGGRLVAPGRTVRVNMTDNRRHGLLIDGTVLALDLTVEGVGNVGSVSADITLEGATVWLRGHSSYVETNVMRHGIVGSGEVIFDAPAVGSPGPTLSVGRIGPGVTVRTGASGGRIDGSPLVRVLNEGRVVSATANRRVVFEYGVVNRGVIRAEGAGAVVASGINEAAGTMVATQGGRLVLSKFTNDGVVTVDAGSTLWVYDVVGGTRPIVMGGTMSAGWSAGSVWSASVACAVDLAPTSVMAFDVGGPLGWQNDYLEFGAPLEIEGRVRVDLLGTYKPLPGDRLRVAKFAGGVTGTFEGVIRGSNTAGVEVRPVVETDALWLEFDATYRGDASLDGFVGLADLHAVGQNWLKQGNWRQGDFTLDGAVGMADLELLAANWMGTAREYYSTANAYKLPYVNVPEPGLVGVAGLVVGCAGAGRRIRRRGWCAA
jgi:hypothetical protein